MLHRRPMLVSLVFGITGLLASSSAFAYIDPGTGSAVLQGILAALAAIGLTLKLYWHRFLKLLGIRKSGEQDQSTASPAPEEQLQQNQAESREKSGNAS